MPVYTERAQLPGAATAFPELPLPDRVLIAEPRDFENRYAINPHMRDADGALKVVDRGRARAQWDALADSFASSGLAVDRLPALEGFPDLVFCANQALPIPPTATLDGVARLVPSRMAHPERRGEVPHVVGFLQQFGYQQDPLTGPAERLEGMGDGLWVLGRRLLLGGVGARTALEAWIEIAQRHRLPIVVLPLADPDFYHLDTALAVLDDRSCIWFPAAFTPEGRALVERLFARRLEVPDDEARRAFACNACSDGRGRVWIEATATRTIAALEAARYEVHRLDTSEFLKSGGSVFCMKLFHGPLD